MADDEGQRGKRRAQPTYQGFATPGIGEPRREAAGEPEPTLVEHTPIERGLDASEERAPLRGATQSSSAHDAMPIVEVEVVHQHGAAPRMTFPAQTVEIWTQNRIYTLDPQLLCVGVADRATGEVDARHPFVGYRLVGGQHREGDTFEISYPFPRPGTEAVFEHPRSARGSFSRTSTVTRVVLRLHVVTVAPAVVVPTWNDITAHEMRSKPLKR